MSLAGKLLPYLSYVLYTYLVLLCVALLAGAALIIRRILKNQPLEGDPAYTKEKIAHELTVEIARIRDLRNRIFPGYQDAGEAAHAAGAVTSTAAVAGPEVNNPAAGGGAVTTFAALPAEEKEKAEKEIEKKFQEKIDSLQTKNKETQDALTAAQTAIQASAGNAAGGASLGTVAQLVQEKTELDDEKKALKAKVDVLEKTLTEYQIFENDIALVKKYKAENDELKRQLSATPQVTEEDIASLFSAMGGSEAKTEAAPTKAPMAVAAPEPEAIPSVAAPEPETISSQSESAELSSESDAEPASSVLEGGPSIDELLQEAGIQNPPEPAPLAASGDDFVVDKLKEEPSINLNPSNISSEDIEALAETDQNSDDKIMAEFQKILGDKP